MQNINQIITTNFQKNIEYFQSKHPTVFAKISAFENAIENGHYTEKYEFVFENGGFDIYEKQTQDYLYKKEPRKFTQLLVNSVDNSRINSVFIASKELDNTALTQDMTEIGKFIFFGVGAATHIEKVCTNFTPKSCFIVEDDLELFRLSLMSINYSLLAQKSELFFAIFEDKNEFKRSSELFLEQQFFENNYIKFLQLPSFSEAKLQEFHTHITTQSHLNFSYKSILNQYTQPLKYLKNNFTFLNLLKTKLPTMPTLLIAPGPSLIKYIGWLEKHQEKFLLIALSATLPILQKHSIVPDIVTHVDGFERSKKHFDSLPFLEHLHQIPLLFSARTPQNILSMFKKKNLFLFENGTNFKNNFGNFSTFCAGSTSYLLSLVLEVQELYLLGLDLAVDQKTLKTHADGYAYNLETKSTNEETLSFRNSLVQTPGNFTESVQTTPNFTLSINAINEITLGLKTPLQKVYNLNDGALFQNIEPLPISQVKTTQVFNKTLLKKELLKNFTQESENSLSLEEQDRITQTIETTKKIESFIKQSLDNVNITKENLREKLIYLFTNLIHEEDSTLSLIIKTYCFTYYPALFDRLNSTLQEDYQTTYEKLVQNLLNIAQTYLKALNE